MGKLLGLFIFSDGDFADITNACGGYVWRMHWRFNLSFHCKCYQVAKFKWKCQSAHFLDSAWLGDTQKERKGSACLDCTPCLTLLDICFHENLYRQFNIWIVISSSSWFHLHKNQPLCASINLIFISINHFECYHVLSLFYSVLFRFRLKLSSILLSMVPWCSGHYTMSLSVAWLVSNMVSIKSSVLL